MTDTDRLAALHALRIEYPGIFYWEDPRWEGSLGKALAATPAPLDVLVAAKALVAATDVIDDWDIRHGYVVNSDRDALAGDLSTAWFNLRAAIAPKEPTP